MKEIGLGNRHIIFIDCGDTLVDEASQVLDANGVTLTAELIPGADRLLKELKARAYRVALVADGYVRTFENILKQHHLRPYFDAMAISEQVGVEKPHAAIFETAMRKMGCADIVDRSLVVMVGNNLSRDIRGANLLGLTSVWIDWAPRRAKAPADAMENPDYVIRTPLALIDILDGLDGAVTA